MSATELDENNLDLLDGYDRKCFAKLGRVMTWGEVIRMNRLCEEGYTLKYVLDYYYNHGCLF